MGFHLVVFAQHDPAEHKDELVAKHVIAEVPNRLVLRRCARAEDLCGVVLAAVRELNMPVSVLDLFDHGRPGHLTMGDPRNKFLFDPTSIGHAIAKDLAELLTFDAHVRLLGCETARGRQGKTMLINLQKAFGKGIVVFGTLSKVDPIENFDQGGLYACSEEARLFSSTEAAALPEGVLAPTYDERYAQRVAWRKRIR